ncbi:hypothetical protein AAFF_G00277070 [Aldrovandia affinis]|uniref:Uncharacterized protein n=1 Tax=Aldrovandia affinis TaxID=143900 RepID=A0AAD7RA93_9TELE|nr:hypothetical protein AAFF_G00277070 [Aldrovandia affinis]
MHCDILHTTDSTGSVSSELASRVVLKSMGGSNWDAGFHRFPPSLTNASLLPPTPVLPWLRGWIEDKGIPGAVQHRAPRH